MPLFDKRQEGERCKSEQTREEEERRTGLLKSSLQNPSPHAEPIRSTIGEIARAENEGLKWSTV